jgi:glycosyltransferase involved in cell wall biosynthesis
MRIALVADTFPPLRNSGAVQLRDLSKEFVRQGHQLTVMLPSADIEKAWQLEDFDGVQVLRLKAPQTKDTTYLRRTYGEFVMPFTMLQSLRKSPLAQVKWQAVVWYAPSIFHGPLVSALKRASGCRGYLIIRDIFPNWAVDMGLLGRGLPYVFLATVARYQYSVADVIGVQTPGNLKYFDAWQKKPNRRVEVLQNWLGAPQSLPCSIDVSKTKLARRKIFVYAGNMGVAQGMDTLIDLAQRLHSKAELGFLFVGRGSDAKRLADEAASRDLNNVLFLPEIDPDEVPGLFAQCHIGLVALDSRHKSHNIPGKFLTYMQSGLPVLASINAGNDLAELIRQEAVGRVSEDGSLATLEAQALELVESLNYDSPIAQRCRALYQRLFTPDAAVAQICQALTIA